MVDNDVRFVADVLASIDVAERMTRLAAYLEFRRTGHHRLSAFIPLEDGTDEEYLESLANQAIAVTCDSFLHVDRISRDSAILDPYGGREAIGFLWVAAYRIQANPDFDGIGQALDHPPIAPIAGELRNALRRWMMDRWPVDERQGILEAAEGLIGPAIHGLQFGARSGKHDTDAAPADEPEAAPSAGEAPDGVSHSPDFRSVQWFGTVYSFTTKQAPMVKLLFENWRAGSPDVGDETLLDEWDPERPSKTRLQNQFRNCPAWGTMIVQGETKGSRRLQPPAEEIR